jgi:hypothetical protein
MDSPDPLGDAPDEMYATAVANTLDGSYTLEWTGTPRADQGLEATLQVDRADRQLRVDSGSEFGVSYLSTGTQTVSTDEGLTGALRRLLTDDTDAVDTGGPHAPPNYFEYASNPAALSLVGELPVVTGWERVETNGNETILELTDRQDVLAFVDTGIRPDRLTELDKSRVRAVVNTETGRLVSVDVAFEARVDPGGQLVINERYSFDPGTDIERPVSVGDPSPEASVWRLLPY